MEIILWYLAQILIIFFILTGILAFFFPIKLSLNLPKNGVLLGIVHVNSDPSDNIRYVFFQFHLVLFSIGVFIQTSSNKDV